MMKSLFYYVQEYLSPANMGNFFFFNKTFQELRKIMGNVFSSTSLENLLAASISEPQVGYYDRH